MLKVRDVLQPAVVTVSPETALKEVARLLVDRGISGLPVVDASGVVVGVVSEADFLVKEQGEGAIEHRPLARFVGDSRDARIQKAKVGALTAGEAMTAPAITIEPFRTISYAAGVMTRRGINRLPVVEGERLVGIVTRADLVRAYVRSDEELAATIRDEVIRRILWVDPAPFDIVVLNGVASIRGRAERRSTAEAIEATARMVPGIVEVDAVITWQLDDSRLEPVSSNPVFPYDPR